MREFSPKLWMTSSTDRTDGYKPRLKLQRYKDSTKGVYPQVAIPQKQIHTNARLIQRVTGFPPYSPLQVILLLMEIA